METIDVKLTDLRAILNYIPEFREKTFILAIDGGIVTDERFATLLLDIALLAGFKRVPAEITREPA